MTDDDVADMFLNLLFAGHDTSAHTIARLLAELPRQPQVWERLVEEQATVSALLREAGCWRISSFTATGFDCSMLHPGLLQRQRRSRFISAEPYSEAIERHTVHVPFTGTSQQGMKV